MNVDKYSKFKNLINNSINEISNNKKLGGNIDACRAPSYFIKSNGECALRKRISFSLDNSVCNIIYSRVFACPRSYQQKITSEEILIFGKHDDSNLFSEYFWNEHMSVSYRYHDDSQKKLLSFRTYTPLTEILAKPTREKELKKIDMDNQFEQSQYLMNEILLKTLTLKLNNLHVT